MTTIYEKYDEKCASTVSSDLQITENKAVQLPPVDNKRRRFIKMQQEIEAKFNKSTMNQGYAFPRKEE